MAYKRTRRRNPADVRAGIKAENVSVYKKPKAKKKSSPKKKSPLAGTPFDPKTPFGKQLPKEAQKAPGSPKVPVPISVPGQKQSFPTSIPTSRGGGGSRQGPTAPLGGTAFDPTQSLGEGIPTIGSPTQPTQLGAGMGFDSPVARGFDPDATTSEKLMAGLDVSMGGGFVTKGLQTAGKLVRPSWNTLSKLIDFKGIKEGVKLFYKGQNYQMFEKGVPAVVPKIFNQLAVYEKVAKEVMIKDAISIFPKISKTAGAKFTPHVSDWVKPTWNEKTGRLVLDVLKKSVGTKGSFQRKIALGLVISAATGTLGASIFSRVMNPNAQGDITYVLGRLVDDAKYSEDPEVMSYVDDVVKETESYIEEIDGVLGDWSLVKYGKTELKKWELLSEKSKVAKMILDKKKNDDALERQYWEEQKLHEEEMNNLIAERQEAERQHDLEMSQLMDDYLSKKIAAEEANDLRDARNWDRKIRKEQKEWDRRQKEIAERDELLRQQRLAEFDAKMKEFNRQQKIFMENWTKRQKFYENQRGSNLGFGLFR